MEQLRKHKNKGIQEKIVILVICLVVMLLVPVVVTEPYTMHIVILMLMFAYMASCWNIVCGFLGQLSVGHCVFVGIGAYISTALFIQAGVTPWLGMIAGDRICPRNEGCRYPCRRYHEP